MTTFGAVWNIFRSIPGKKCLPQTSARRNDTNGAARDRLSDIQCPHVVRTENGNCPGDRFQIVNQPHRFEIEILRQRSLIHHPGQVGDLRASLNDWTSNIKTRSLNLNLLLQQKLRYQDFEAWIVRAVHLSLTER